MAADYHFTFTDIAVTFLYALPELNINALTDRLANGEIFCYTDTKGADVIIRAWHPGDERISKELSSASTRDDSPGLIEFARQHEIAVSGGCLPS